MKATCIRRPTFPVCARATFVIAVVVGGAGCGGSDTISGTDRVTLHISGTVYGAADGLPAGGAVVSLLTPFSETDTSHTVLARTTTDPTGHFAIVRETYYYFCTSSKLAVEQVGQPTRTIKPASNTYLCSTSDPQTVTIGTPK